MLGDLRVYRRLCVLISPCPLFTLVHGMAMMWMWDEVLLLVFQKLVIIDGVSQSMCIASWWWYISHWCSLCIAILTFFVIVIDNHIMAQTWLEYHDTAGKYNISKDNVHWYVGSWFVLKIVCNWPGSHFVVNFPARTIDSLEFCILSLKKPGHVDLKNIVIPTICSYCNCLSRRRLVYNNRSDWNWSYSML